SASSLCSEPETDDAHLPYCDQQKPPSKIQKKRKKKNANTQMLYLQPSRYSMEIAKSSVAQVS
ncbi:hypothetical protein OFC03_27860, partial [Escherichia coli]|nr:hypothetical protein [Escherichia coli]